MVIGIFLTVAMCLDLRRNGSLVMNKKQIPRRMKLPHSKSSTILHLSFLYIIPKSHTLLMMLIVCGIKNLFSQLFSLLNEMTIFFFVVWMIDWGGFVIHSSPPPILRSMIKMASGTRGKLKEHMIGVHKDCDWIKKHCIDCVKLLGDDYEQHRQGFESLHAIAVMLDDFASSLYSKL